MIVQLQGEFATANTIFKSNDERRGKMRSKYTLSVLARYWLTVISRSAFFYIHIYDIAILNSLSFYAKWNIRVRAEIRLFNFS